MKTLNEISKDLECYACGGVVPTIPEGYSKRQIKLFRKLNNYLDDLDPVEDADKSWKMLDKITIKIYKLNK